METESSEHRDITELLHDAFVRICRLAIADCGVSVAELTLHLSIQLKTGVPQILSTTVKEMVRSSLDNENHGTEFFAAGGSEALNKTQSSGNDENGDQRQHDTKLYNDSIHSAVCMEDKSGGFHSSIVAVQDVTPSRTKQSTPTNAVHSHLPSCLVNLNNANSLIMSEDDDDVPLDEFLADVAKSKEPNSCVDENPAASLESGENTLEVDKVYGSGCASLSNFVSSDDSLLSVNSPSILSTLQSYDSDLQTRCTSTLSAHNSSGRCDTDNTSFLQNYHFGEQRTMCSNSACISAESAFCGLGEFAEETDAENEVSRSDGDEIEVEGLSTSRHSSLCSNVADRSARDDDNSYEEELIVDECCSSSDAHSCHLPATKSSVSLFLPGNQEPVCSEALMPVKDVSLLKPYAANHFLSTFCPSVLTSDASVGSYSQHANMLFTSPNSYRLITVNADNTACDTRRTEFQKILSSVATRVTEADRDDLQALKAYVAVDQFAEDRMKRFPCSHCNCSFSMQTNLRRHVKKAHCQPLWRPLPPVTGPKRGEHKSGSSSKSARVSCKDSSRYRHKCSMCNAAFTLRTNLTRHVRKVHGNDSGSS